MKKLIALVGTNAKESTNRQLLNYMKKHFTKEASIELLEIADLPLFNKPINYTIHPKIQKMAAKIAEADGVIIATPEYDHGPPAALTNALAWLSYKVYPFVDQPVMVVGASYGTLGSSRAQLQLLQILESPELKARTMPSSEFLLNHSLDAFDENGDLVYTEKVKELEAIFSDFLVFIDLVQDLPNARKLHEKTAKKYIWDTM
jgi:NAD(P)H-dependent FMN reductase